MTKLEELKKYCGDDKLKNDILDIIVEKARENDGTSEERFFDAFQDCLHGADTGTMADFIYTDDCVKFFDNHIQDILNFINNDILNFIEIQTTLSKNTFIELRKVILQVYYIENSYRIFEDDLILSDDKKQDILFYIVDTIVYRLYCDVFQGN